MKQVGMELTPRNKSFKNATGSSTHTLTGAYCKFCSLTLSPGRVVDLLLRVG